MSWIKMRTDLRNHPKVVRMASALKADKLRVLGGMFAMWSVFDAHSIDGELEGYTLQAMDDEVGLRGFSAAMVAIKWLEVDDEGLRVPRFEDHNGASAKRRATDSKLKQSARAVDKSANGARKTVADLSADDADKKVDIERTREEKRREEEEKTGRATAEALARTHAVGLASKALRQAGINSNPSDPRLVALVAQGVQPDEFAAVAAEAVAQGITALQWVITAVTGRRAKAAAIAIEQPPAADPMEWTKTRDGVIAMACELGMGPFETLTRDGYANDWGAYRRGVIEAASRNHHGATA